MQAGHDTGDEAEGEGQAEQSIPRGPTSRSGEEGGAKAEPGATRASVGPPAYSPAPRATPAGVCGLGG